MNMYGMRIVNLDWNKNVVSNTKLETPINNFQQLMAITAEECAELTQVCMKLMRKYDSLDKAAEDKYIDLLLEEAGDVLCMLELMSEYGLFDWKEIYARADVKREKLKQWSNLVE
jgi:NTP pyrophosphatase (non-canonical NTP hydrolase)